MAKLEWFVQTFQPSDGSYLPEFETWHGYNEDDARIEFAKDHRIPQHCERRLVTYGVQDDGATASRIVGRRIVERFLAGPVTLHGSLIRNARAWATQGCAVSELLTHANETTTNDKADFVAIESGTLSYLPTGKVHKVNADGTWDKVGRQEAKPGKFIRTILVDASGLTDHQIEQFANRVKAVNELQSGAMHVVRGADIAYWYHASSSGNNNVSSCMAHDGRIKFLRMYCDNPEKIGLLIMLDNDGFMKGRALVWELDDGRTYMDRIYGRDAVRSAFQKYADEHGWIHMYSTAWRYTQENRSRNKADANTLFCTIARSYDPKGKYDDTGEKIVHPYVDTMRFLNRETGRLTNDNRMRHTHIMGYAEGGAEEVDIRWFPAEGEPEPRKDKWGNYLEPDEPDYTHRCNVCYDRFVCPPYEGHAVNAYWYCRVCADAHAPVCTSCNTRKVEYSRYPSQPRGVCDDCHRNGRVDCPECNELVDPGDMVDVRDGYMMCRPCRDRYYIPCNACGETKHRGDFLYDETGGYENRNRMNLCADCYHGEYYRLRNDSSAHRKMATYLVRHGIRVEQMYNSLHLSREGANQWQAEIEAELAQENAG